MTSRNRAAPARLTEGPITRSLVRLAWPVFVSRALHTLYGTADTAWVGRLGPDAIAAVSTSFYASWSLLAVGNVLVGGVTALVAQSVGARRDDEALRVALTGVVLAIVLGAVVAAGGWIGSPFLFRLLFDDPVLVRMGTEYLSLFSLLAPVFYVSFVAESVYRACGDSRTPMKVLLLGTLLNIVLDPLLIFGLGPFPRLEVRGAAIATMIAESSVLLAYGVLYAQRHLPLPLRLSESFRSWSGLRARQMIRIGGPEALIEILFSVVYLVLARVTGTFGAATAAALGIVNRLESVTYLAAAAVGMAVATLVGQNIGARRVERAEACAHRGAQLAGGVGGVLMLVFLFVPEPIVRIFTSDPAAVEQSVAFLRIVAISQVFMGWELVYGQAFLGAGDTLPPMYISSSISLLRIPLALGLTLHTTAGVAGIWWTISLTGIARGILLTAWFRSGRWKKMDLRIAPAARPPVPVGPEGPGG